MNERRATIRVPAGVEGNYRRLKSLSAPHLGWTLDISLGGMRFASTDRLDPGESIAVSLNLPKEGTVTLTGLVLWSREVDTAGQTGYEAGLKWSQVDPHAQARLNAFLTEFTHSDYAPVSSTFAVPVETINWADTVVIALITSVVLWASASLWIRQLQRNIEMKSLRYLVASYEQQLDHLLK